MGPRENPIKVNFREMRYLTHYRVLSCTWPNGLHMGAGELGPSSKTTMN